MAFSSVPRNSEEGRAFLQQRLALFGGAAFLLFAVIIMVGLLSFALLLPGGLGHLRTPPYHVLAVLGVGLVWVICRRGTHSPRTLAVIDAAMMLIAGTGISMTLLVGQPDMLPGVPVALSLTHLLIARAIIVPSDWRRTLWISSLAALPGAGLTLALGADGIGAAKGGLPPPILSQLLPFWIAVAVGVAAWTSHVIYRLRRRVAEARTLGQYTLEDKIGEGGMGVVFRARHAMLRRPTVIKLLPPEKAGHANLARFEREVQHTSLLSSPNTVAVYDYGRTPDGIFYYAMEHLDGIDLDRLVAESGAQPAGRVIHVLAQACAALAEAHEAGLIHRDIKPGNIMLCRHGGAFDVVKVLDFGLVKDVAGGGDVTKLTLADALLGTPLYMSPESMTDPDLVEGRSDLYALGAVGYFLATGTHVFEGRTLAELCAHHLTTVPTPPSERRPGVPRDLEAILLACLEKGMAERPADARALRAGLLACADAGSWSEDQARAWWSKRGGSSDEEALAETMVAAAKT